MRKTIRDRIKHRVRWTLGIALFGWFLAAAPGLVAMATRSAPRAAIGASMLGLLTFAVAFISMMFIRCPKCSARISHTIAVPVGFSFGGLRQRINYCPYCGVSLDEACPEPGNRIMSPDARRQA